MIHHRSGNCHAECDPSTGYCSTHYDEYDPNDSVSSLLKHMWQSDLGKMVIVGAGTLLLSKLLEDSKG